MDKKFVFFQIQMSEVQKWSSNLRVKSDDKSQVYNIFILKGRTVGQSKKMHTKTREHLWQFSLANIHRIFDRRKATQSNSMRSNILQ